MAHQRRSNQEWLAIFRQFENSSLTQREFCRRHDISTSTFFAKRRLLECDSGSQQGGFIRAEVVEQTTHYQVANPIASNMTLSVNDIELSIPQGTPAAYVAELIGSLSS
ncbi:IS66 family insertion sequence element accessory protein TnpA [Photobacterium sp. DNB23_23_1]|uniref:IS66 family insertion sequence element accessory protein TnpB n=1 Tax=Photobacterium pectinilyticum TaxID=2906793 RepID=A0ABT1NCN4_9GAMM|nr:IS66 family insertion sequence element accessory protein TnpB [Photobacterium sp. ZSDE20]MCQ1061421.1 IS66 family insertion sequence element accessory protein TnpB [Photobacterium sp. ZSDE20]MDD1830230.1 IS66 family insertion sequence element accessory protein TnpB [Photobacterium sp. ZSDE20]